MAVNLNEIPPASDFNPAEVEEPDVDLTKPNNIADDGTPRSVMVANLNQPVTPMSQFIDKTNADWVRNLQQRTAAEAEAQRARTQRFDKEIRELYQAVERLEEEQLVSAADAMRIIIEKKFEELTLEDCRMLLKMIYADKNNSERESSNA